MITETKRVQMIIDALAEAYSMCNGSPDFVSIAIDALDQAGVSVRTQRNILDIVCADLDRQGAL